MTGFALADTRLLTLGSLMLTNACPLTLDSLGGLGGLFSLLHVLRASPRRPTSNAVGARYRAAIGREDVRLNTIECGSDLLAAHY